jgi:glutathione S-transferase
MILVGQYDSPYVRRVAVTLNHLGLAFARRDLSVFGDAAEMRKINPLGRVPSLVLDDGEILVDSAAILDHLDEVVGPQRALLPAGGAERRHALQIVMLATGAMDKAITLGYEHLLRPAGLRHQPWIDRNKTQLDSAIVALEALVPDNGWLGGGRLLQPDITLAAAMGYLRLRRNYTGELPPHPRLSRHAKDAEALPEFVAALPTVEEIGGADAAADLDRMRRVT